MPRRLEMSKLIVPFWSIWLNLRQAVTVCFTVRAQDTNVKKRRKSLCISKKRCMIHHMLYLPLLWQGTTLGADITLPQGADLSAPFQFRRFPI